LRKERKREIAKAGAVEEKEDKRRGDRGRAMSLVLVEAGAGPGCRRTKENRSRANERPVQGTNTGRVQLIS
jgi:hypothetical protein